MIFLFSLPFTNCLSVLLKSRPKTLNSFGCHLNNLVGLSVCLPDNSLKNLFWFQRGKGEKGHFLEIKPYVLCFFLIAWDPSFLMISTPDNIDSVTLFSISRWMFLSFFLMKKSACHLSYWQVFARRSEAKLPTYWSVTRLSGHLASEALRRCGAATSTSVRRTHSAHSVPCIALNKCPGRICPASHLWLPFLCPYVY